MGQEIDDPSVISDSKLATIEGEVTSSLQRSLCPSAVLFPGGVNVAPKNWLDDYHQVGSVTFTSGTPVEIKILENLLDISQYVDAFTNNAFAKFDLKVRVVLNSSPFQYGRIICSCIPWVGTPTTNPRYSNGVWNYYPIVLDVSAADSCEFYLPYNAPALLRTEHSFEQMWTLCMHPLFSRTSTAVSANCRCFVYAKFENVNLAVPKGINMELIQSSASKGKRKAQAQSQTMVSYREEQSYNVLGSLAAAGTVAAGYFGGQMGGYDYLTQLLGSPFELGSAVGAAVKLSEVENGFVNKFRKHEDMKNSHIGVPDSLATTVRSGGILNLSSQPNQQFVDPAFLMDDTLVHSLKSIACRPALYGGVSNPINVNPLNGSSANVVIRCRPQEGGVFGATNHPTYFDFISQCFRFYRGGMKFKIQFFLPPTQVAEVYIRAHFGNGTVPVNLDYLYKKQVILKGSTTVEFEVPYCNAHPWAALDTFNNAAVNRESEEDVFLSITMGGLISLGDVTSNVFMLVWTSASEDIRFASPVSPCVQTSEGVEKVVSVAQSDIMKDFCKPFDMFPGFQKNITTYTPADETFFVEELLSRYSTITDNSRVSNDTTYRVGPTALLPVTGDGTSNMRIDLFSYVSNIFRFWTGSIVHKIVIPESDPTVGLSAQKLLVVKPMPAHVSPTKGAYNPWNVLDPVGGDGVGLMFSSAEPSVTIEYPYLSLLPCAATYVNAEYETQFDQPWWFMISNSGNNLSGSLQYIKAGPNYQVGHVWLTPNGQRMPASP